MKSCLTTFETSRLCGVVHTTIIRWIKDGKLKAYETPGGHRRIQIEDLLAFMKHYNMPIPAAFPKNMPSIMALDDNKQILSMIRKAFETFASDIELYTTSNPVEAMVMLGNHPADLLILDVIMPAMDGIQVCKTLKTREETAKMKIIVITGKLLSHEQEDFLNRNADYVMRKPFSPVELIEHAVKLLKLNVFSKK